MPHKKRSLAARELVLAALFSALIAVGTFIKIPTPLLPLTLQFLFTNLAGRVLGSRLGAIAVTGYVALGLAGLPVFTAGGGISYVLHPTFGYIVGFVVGAWIAGRVTECLGNGFRNWLMASLANLLVLYTLGILYYCLIARFYLGNVIAFRTLLWSFILLPLPGDLLSCFVSAVLVGRLESFGLLKRVSP